MKILYVTLLLILVVAAMIFAVQNSIPVTMTLFSWSVTGSLSLLLIITLIAGILIGVLIMAPSVFRRSVQSSNLKRKVSELEKEARNRGGEEETQAGADSQADSQADSGADQRRQKTSP